MIEGIKIEMTTAQVKAHVDGRASYHDGKARWYTEQVETLSRGGLGARTNVSNDPVSSLQASQRTHEQQAAFFRILSEHLIPNETYRLAESDLARLELVSRYY